MAVSYYVTLDEARAQLNDPSPENDLYIESLIPVAQSYIEKWIQQPLSTFAENGELTPMLKHAIKIEIANLFSNRESVAFSSTSAIPHNLSALVTPFIKFL